MNTDSSVRPSREDNGASPNLGRLGFVVRTHAKQGDRTATRGENAGQHLDGGGLARAVSTQETVERPRLYAQVKILHGAETPEHAAKLARVYGVIGGLDQLASFVHSQTPFGENRQGAAL